VYYNGSALTLGLMAQQSKDADSHKLVTGSAGATYVVGPVRLYSYYIYAKRDAGFEIGASGTSNPLANTSFINNATTALGPQTDPRVDQFFKAGVGYQALPTLRLTLAYACDHAKDVAPGSNGTMTTPYGIADYNLSKRTDIYLEVDDSHISGASVGDTNSPLTTALGVRQVFGTSVSLRTVFWRDLADACNID
jgi:predicted porin